MFIVILAAMVVHTLNLFENVSGKNAYVLLLFLTPIPRRSLEQTFLTSLESRLCASPATNGKAISTPNDLLCENRLHTLKKRRGDNRMKMMFDIFHGDNYLQPEFEPVRQRCCGSAAKTIVKSRYDDLYE